MLCVRATCTNPYPSCLHHVNDLQDECLTGLLVCGVCAGTLAGVIGVAVTGYILDAAGGADSIAGWWRAHSLAAVILLGALLVFNMFAKGTRQFD